MGIIEPTPGLSIPIVGIIVPSLGLSIPIVGIIVPTPGLSIPIVGVILAFSIPIMGIVVPILCLSIPIVGIIVPTLVIFFYHPWMYYSSMGWPQAITGNLHSHYGFQYTPGIYTGNRSTPTFKHKPTMGIELHYQEWDSFKLGNLYNPDMGLQNFSCVSLLSRYSPRKRKAKKAACKLSDVGKRTKSSTENGADVLPSEFSIVDDARSDRGDSPPHLTAESPDIHVVDDDARSDRVDSPPPLTAESPDVIITAFQAPLKTSL